MFSYSYNYVLYIYAVAIKLRLIFLHPKSPKLLMGRLSKRFPTATQNWPPWEVPWFASKPLEPRLINNPLGVHSQQHLDGDHPIQSHCWWPSMTQTFGIVKGHMLFGSARHRIMVLCYTHSLTFGRKFQGTFWGGQKIPRWSQMKPLFRVSYRAILPNSSKNQKVLHITRNDKYVCMVRRAIATEFTGFDISFDLPGMPSEVPHFWGNCCWFWQ